MQKPADIATSYACGERGMGKYTGRRTLPTHDEIDCSDRLYRINGHESEPNWLPLIGCLLRSNVNEVLSAITSHPEEQAVNFKTTFPQR